MHGRTPAARSVALGALSAAVLIAGCRAGGEDLDVVNNQLREENMRLRDQVTALEQQNAELRQAVRASSPEAGAISIDVQAFVPRVTAITLDRLTAVADTPNGPVLRAYVKPADGRGRFVQMTGDLTLKLVRVPEAEQAEAETLAAQRFGPEAVRDAYRSGFMGTHYTFELPTSLPEAEAGESLLVVASFVDGVTGETFKTERAVTRPR